MFGRPHIRQRTGGLTNLVADLARSGRNPGGRHDRAQRRRAGQKISGRTDEQVCYRAPICLSNDCERSRSCVPTRKWFGRGYSRIARAPTPGHSTSSGSEHRGQVLTRTVRSTFFSSIPRRLPRLPVLITTFWRVTPGFLSAEPSWTNGGVCGTALVAE